MTILAVYRDAFSFAPEVRRLPDGITLAAMRQQMTCLPDDFDRHGAICIDGVPVPSAVWGMVRPKPEVVTEITFHFAPRIGGSGDGGKNVFGIIASIALSVATGFIATGGLGGMSMTGGLFTAGSVSALMLAAGVSLAGSLLLSALIPPPTVASSKGPKQDRDPGAASAQGNVLSPNAPIPRVVGERKVFPPLAMEPLTYFDGPDEVVEAAYVLAGPHRIRDIRVGAAPIVGMAGIEHEVREGWQGDPLIDILRRQARSEGLQSELRGHVVDSEDGRTLESIAGDLVTSLPLRQVLATRQAPDEHQLQITLPQGLSDTMATENPPRLRIPLRIRMRRVGSEDWINLPELQFQGARLGQIRATLRLVWGAGYQAPAAASDEGWAEARSHSPGQTEVPPSDPWDAHPYFDSGNGNNWMDANNLGATRLRNISMDRYTASVWLDPAIFPRGRYEIELIRGCAFRRGNYSASAYTYGGSVWDFFGVRGVPGQIAMSRDKIVDTFYLMRSVSIWNEPPLPSRDLAVVAIRARNRAVDTLSCIAGGWVRDLGESGDWDAWTVTDNPAPHLRDIFTGLENLDPVPLDIIDDDGLRAWRQHCITQGYSCNALIEDLTVDDAARIVASCGYGKPYASDVWGVIWDRDRRADAPMQIFTPRNMSGFQWTKGFARVPDGFRVNFPDASRDYDQHQISVFRPGNSDDSGRMEQINYEGIVHEADAIRHAEYDQMQAQLRSTFYSWDCAAESILCRRGDLIGVQHDMLSAHAGSARITGIDTDQDDNITAIRLDSMVPIEDHPFMDESPDLSAEEDLSLLGLRSGIAISRDTGVTVHPVHGGDGLQLMFSPAIPATGIAEGALVVAGPIGREYLRLIVFGVAPQPDFEATITAVDEAPQLWN